MCHVIGASMQSINIHSLKWKDRHQSTKLEPLVQPVTNKNIIITRDVYTTPYSNSKYHHLEFSGLRSIILYQTGCNSWFSNSVQMPKCSDLYWKTSAIRVNSSPYNASYENAILILACRCVVMPLFITRILCRAVPCTVTGILSYLFISAANRHILDVYSLSGRTSYRKISWSLEAARLCVIMIVSSWNLTGISVAVLSRCLS